MTFDLQHTNLFPTLSLWHYRDPLGAILPVGVVTIQLVVVVVFKSTLENHVYLHSITFCAADMAQKSCQTDSNVALKV